MRSFMLLLLLIASGPVVADWQRLANSGNGDVVWLYEPDEVRRSGAIVEVWVKVTGEGFKKVVLDDYRRRGAPRTMIDTFDKIVSYSFDQWQIDCKVWTMQLLHSSTYDAQGGPFDSMPTRVLSSDRATAIPPDSLMHRAARKLCNP